jgi:hypothetical protein
LTGTGELNTQVDAESRIVHLGLKHCTKFFKASEAAQQNIGKTNNNIFD